MGEYSGLEKIDHLTSHNSSFSPPSRPPNYGSLLVQSCGRSQAYEGDERAKESICLLLESVFFPRAASEPLETSSPLKLQKMALGLWRHFLGVGGGV